MAKRLDDKQLAAAAVELRYLTKEHAGHLSLAEKAGKRISELKATLRAELGDGIPF